MFPVDINSLNVPGSSSSNRASGDQQESHQTASHVSETTSSNHLLPSGSRMFPTGFQPPGLQTNSNRHEFLDDDLQEFIRAYTEIKNNSNNQLLPNGQQSSFSQQSNLNITECLKKDLLDFFQSAEARSNLSMDLPTNQDTNVSEDNDSQQLVRVPGNIQNVASNNYLQPNVVQRPSLQTTNPNTSGVIWNPLDDSRRPVTTAHKVPYYLLPGPSYNETYSSNVSELPNQLETNKLNYYKPIMNNSPETNTCMLGPYSSLWPHFGLPPIGPQRMAMMSSGVSNQTPVDNKGYEGVKSWFNPNTCPVCRENCTDIKKGLGCHYGGISCLKCSSFFSRVMKGDTALTTCEKIDRYQMCLLAGMKPEYAVRKDPKPSMSSKNAAPVTNYTPLTYIPYTSNLDISQFCEVEMKVGSESIDLVGANNTIQTNELFVNSENLNDSPDQISLGGDVFLDLLRSIQPNKITHALKDKIIKLQMKNDVREKLKIILDEFSSESQHPEELGILQNETNIRELHQHERDDSLTNEALVLNLSTKVYSSSSMQTNFVPENNTFANKSLAQTQSIIHPEQIMNIIREPDDDTLSNDDRVLNLTTKMNARGSMKIKEQDNSFSTKGVNKPRVQPKIQKEENINIYKHKIYNLLPIEDQVLNLSTGIKGENPTEPRVLNLSSEVNRLNSMDIDEENSHTIKDPNNTHEKSIKKINQEPNNNLIGTEGDNLFLAESNDLNSTAEVNDLSPMEVDFQENSCIENLNKNSQPENETTRSQNIVSSSENPHCTVTQVPIPLNNNALKVESEDNLLVVKNTINPDLPPENNIQKEQTTNNESGNLPSFKKQMLNKLSTAYTIDVVSTDEETASTSLTCKNVDMVSFESPNDKINKKNKSNDIATTTNSSNGQSNNLSIPRRSKRIKTSSIRKRKVNKSEICICTNFTNRELRDKSRKRPYKDIITIANDNVLYGFSDIPKCNCHSYDFNNECPVCGYYFRTMKPFVVLMEQNNFGLAKFDK